MVKNHGTRPEARRGTVGIADPLPEGYEAFLGQLKERIRTARLRGELAANHATGKSAGRSPSGKRPSLGNSRNRCSTLIILRPRIETRALTEGLDFVVVFPTRSGIDLDHIGPPPRR